MNTTTNSEPRIKFNVTASKHWRTNGFGKPEAFHFHMLQPFDPTPDADGWILHDGKGCPVAGDVIVDVKWVDGRERNNYNADFWNWKKLGRPSDITHYRLAKPAPEPKYVPWIERLKAVESLDEMRDLLIEKFDVDNQSV